MKRRPILLLELLTAFILMGGVIALLMSGFFDAIKAKNIAREDKDNILTRHRLQLKFASMLKSCISAVALEENKYYFRFMGGADPDPEFRQEVDAVLQLKDKKLILYTYPTKGKERRELLAENVGTIKFEFFDEEKKDFIAMAYQQLPRMVKITLDEEVLPIFL